MNYKKHYDLLMLRSKSRILKGYKEKHHIVPKCLGGCDKETNLTFLTAREHYIAHQLLIKMNPEHLGLSYAAMLMVRLGNGNGRINNRRYEWLKIRYSNLQSLYMKEYLKTHKNPSEKLKVKQKRKEFWLGDKNPSYKNPNWKAIKAASDATRGKPQKQDHSEKISESIKRWHVENPNKHPMKNPETLAKAIASRKRTFQNKKRNEK